MTSFTTMTSHLDMRQLPAREHQPLILGHFDYLAPGDALLLVDDHDSRPLFRPSWAESRSELTWNYLEKGAGLCAFESARSVAGQG